MLSGRVSAIARPASNALKPPISRWHLCWRTRQAALGDCAVQRRRAGSIVESFNYASREEERLVKSTLHELGTQREDMKLSLKVYHFQELSRTSLRDTELSRDPRFQQLKEDLREDVDRLSPAQLVAALASCAELRVVEKAFWWDMARGVEQHSWKSQSGKPGLQFSQMSLALYSLSKGPKVKDRVYYRLMKIMMKQPSIWTEYDMAWLMAAMRRRRLNPTDEEKKEHRLWARVQFNVAYYMNQKCHLISPQGLVILLHEFAKNKQMPGKAVMKGVKRIRQYLPSITDRGLVSTAVMLATFDWPEKRLLRRLSEELREPRRFVRMDHNSLVVILHAYAKLAVRDVPLLQAVTNLLARSCDQLTSRSCGMLAYSLGKLGVRGDVWAALAERVESRAHRLSPLNIALVAHGFGKVGASEGRALLTGPLAEVAKDCITGFTAKQLACLLDGLTLAGAYREDLFRLALDEYIRLGSLGGHQRNTMMARVIYSAALEHPELLVDAPPAWQSLLARAKSAKQHAPTRAYHGELALCAYALSVKGQTQRRKGPFVVDLHIQTPEGERIDRQKQRGVTPEEGALDQANGPIALAVHLVADAETCPLTAAYLGPTRLRQRQLGMMGWLHVGLGRKEWLELPDTDARTDALARAIGKHVPIRRRELPQLPGTGVEVLGEDEQRLALEQQKVQALLEQQTEEKKMLT